MITHANLSNPWKTAVIGVAIVVPLMLAVGTGAFALRSPSLRAAASSGESAKIERRVVEDCNQYAAAAKRDTGGIVRDGAIAKGGEGAGKSAGIGAVLGATIGALRGLSEENQKSEAARAAYSNCLARRGY